MGQTSVFLEITSSAHSHLRWPVEKYKWIASCQEETKCNKMLHPRVKR